MLLSAPSTADSPAVRPPVNVRVREHSFEEWDDYVQRHSLGSPFHLSAWRTCIAGTFGYKPIYLEAECDGVIRGVLPLFLVTGILVRKALISTPFAVYGGALADDGEAYSVLAAKAREMGERLGVQYIELRNAWPQQALGFSPFPRYVTFTQEIDSTADAILERIPRKTRRMVRKSIEQNFDVRVETNDPRRFEELYSANLQRLGTPAFPRKHFQALLRNFRNSVDIREYSLNGELAAAVLTFYFRGQVMPYYGASDPRFNSSAPNNFMYFDLMCQGAARGDSTFDFGRSKKGVPGSYDFKSHWGMMERELPYERLLVRAKKMPDLTPVNPAFQWPIRIWRKMPLGLTRRLGPLLIRLVP